MFYGSFTALITPFTKEGEIDEIALRSLVDFQISQGITGLVPVGTTGESPTLTHEEFIRVVEIVIEQTQNRVPVIVGSGANSTKKAIELTRIAYDLGASASLQVAPYYNKPSQVGFFHHFTEIANAVPLPLILYNIPGRTGKNMEVETIVSLLENKNIVGIKEATGNITHSIQILEKCKNACVLSGDDNLALAIIALGGHGVISVASNVFPKEVTSLISTALEGNMSDARTQFYAMLPFLNTCLQLETNPIPIKYVASLLGLCEEVYRLPLFPLTEQQKNIAKKVFDDYKSSL